MSREEEELQDFDPAQIGVLVVDPNQSCLKYLLFILEKCRYGAITGVADAKEALATLRNERDRFHLVVTSFVVKSMTGFELLDAINREFDLPVIMVSADERQSCIMEAIEHGALDYLLKPVRIKEIRNLWQHVFRKKMKAKNREINNNINRETTVEGAENHGDVQLDDHNDLMEAGMEEDDESGTVEPTNSASSSQMKKTRVRWTPELHQKFLDAYEELGEENADAAQPKKILELMDVPWLTRGNVASHLQKHKQNTAKQDNPNQLDRSCFASTSLEPENRLLTDHRSTSAEFSQHRNFSFPTNVQQNGLPANPMFTPAPFRPMPLNSYPNPCLQTPINGNASARLHRNSMLRPPPCFNQMAHQRPFLGMQNIFCQQNAPAEPRIVMREPVIGPVLIGQTPLGLQQAPAESLTRGPYPQSNGIMSRLVPETLIGQQQAPAEPITQGLYSQSNGSMNREFSTVSGLVPETLIGQQQAPRAIPSGLYLQSNGSMNRESTIVSRELTTRGLYSQSNGSMSGLVPETLIGQQQQAPREPIANGVYSQSNGTMNRESGIFNPNSNQQGVVQTSIMGNGSHLGSDSQADEELHAEIQSIIEQHSPP